MKARELHSWRLTPSQAIEVQRELASEVVRTGDVVSPRYIAGADIAVGRDRRSGRAVMVVLDYPALRPVEVATASGELEFPYVPGLLSFREAPLLLKAWDRLSITPELLFVDGQGLAHPRRMGIACHLGLVLDTPTIGCAKSRLCGEAAEPSDEVGCRAELRDAGEVVGTVLRTRTGSKPLYISVGHRLSLENAVRWVMLCLRGHRLPEPARLAHLAAGGGLAPLEPILC
jgi:deoxyribonuclease V